MSHSVTTFYSHWMFQNSVVFHADCFTQLHVQFELCLSQQRIPLILLFKHCLTTNLHRMDLHIILIPPFPSILHYDTQNSCCYSSSSVNSYNYSSHRSSLHHKEIHVLRQSIHHLLLPRIRYCSSPHRCYFMSNSVQLTLRYS